MPSDSTCTLNIAVDQRFEQTPDGAVWAHTPPAYDFFGPVLEVFDRVRILARMCAVTEPSLGVRRVDGPGVEPFPIPCFVGPFEYLRTRHKVMAALNHAEALDGAFLLRIPSQTGFALAGRLRRRRRSFAVELLTDPRDFFAWGVGPHGLATLFRPYFCAQTRELCAAASSANYVTGRSTMEAFPPAAAGWSGNVSDVDLPAEAFLTPRSAPPAMPLRLISVGLLDHLYKGQDTLIAAVADCVRSGLSLTLTFAGDGRHHDQLSSLASRLGIADRVFFTGPLAGAAAVRQHLVQSDLFVLPSRAEGIPRALLEAMAAGLPAITSNVGAMPDLLPKECIVPPADKTALAQRILYLASRRRNWLSYSQENQRRARFFAREEVQPRRKEFYRSIRESFQQSQAFSEYSHAA
ncbi:MAG: glycosyltransferase family 4 protein [Bryobacter sp.]|jgi:glycosyltransferase involved in cell wall biosynthesis|nr:glycosyltransferase family 4 protein [Bryobacter sp. CoA8 C33]